MAFLTAPLLSVAPIRALVDEKFQVQVKNLPAGLPFTLHSLHFSEDNDYWEAFGHYISNHNGTVCVSEHLSLGGTYTGRERMGLLWSLRPVPGSRKGLRLRKMNVSSPLLYTISVYSGHLTEGFRDQTPLASVLTERWYMAPGVQRISIKHNTVRGTLFLPPGNGPCPGILDMWGGGGGLIEYRAAILASNGYAALALKYFAPGELETTEMEMNYFETAFNIVKDHPRVIPDKVGIVGLSFGATIAFHLASESNVIRVNYLVQYAFCLFLSYLIVSLCTFKKPCCCVCINGHTLYPHGKSIGEITSLTKSKIRLEEDNNQIWKHAYELSNDTYKIDVVKINCPMLLVCGEDDQNVPAMETADDIEQIMCAAGKGHLLTRINYPGAGHLIEVPYAPHFRVTVLRVTKTQTAMVVWGGHTKPHSDAQEDSWKKILDYLQHHLFSGSSLKAKL